MEDVKHPDSKAKSGFEFFKRLPSLKLWAGNDEEQRNALKYLQDEMPKRKERRLSVVTAELFLNKEGKNRRSRE